MPKDPIFSDLEVEETSVLIMRYSDTRLELEAAGICLEIETISRECEV
jgi:hypothetical protein